MFAEQQNHEPSEQATSPESGTGATRYTRGSLTTALKTDTRSAHEDVEEGNRVNQILAGKRDPVRPGQLARGELSADAYATRQEQYREVYIAALKAQYGFERALEETLDSSPFGTIVYQAIQHSPPKQKASDLIAADLKALGHEPPEELMPLPDYGSIPEALGALYVRMGSRMGGMIIAKNAAVSLGIDDSSGAHYYGMYGANTLKEFTAFLKALDTYTDAPEDIDAAVRSANNTFRAVGIWQQHVYEQELPEVVAKLRPSLLRRGLNALGRWFIQD